MIDQLVVSKLLYVHRFTGAQVPPPLIFLLYMQRNKTFPLFFHLPHVCCFLLQVQEEQIPDYSTDPMPEGVSPARAPRVDILLMRF